MPDVRASSDPAVIARGEYLVYGPAHCVECHSSSFEEFQKVVNGEKVPLQGGTRFEAPPLGAIYSKNLTPDPETGIGRYTDGQIARMMRYNVRPDGRASVAPMMPFHNMSDEDMIAIISFLRAQPPVRNQVPDNEWTLAGQGHQEPLVNVQAARRTREPAEGRARGEADEGAGRIPRALRGATASAATRRWTTRRSSRPGPNFRAAEEFEPMPLPGADMKTWFRTPNITPQKGSALMKFPDRATFVARFKVGGRQHPARRCRGRHSRA